MLLLNNLKAFRILTFGYIIMAFNLYNLITLIEHAYYFQISLENIKLRDWY